MPFPHIAGSTMETTLTLALGIDQLAEGSHTVLVCVCVCVCVPTLATYCRPQTCSIVSEECQVSADLPVSVCHCLSVCRARAGKNHGAPSRCTCARMRTDVHARIHIRMHICMRALMHTHMYAQVEVMPVTDWPGAVPITGNTISFDMLSGDADSTADTHGAGAGDRPALAAASDPLEVLSRLSLRACARALSLPPGKSRSFALALSLSRSLALSLSRSAALSLSQGTSMMMGSLFRSRSPAVPLSRSPALSGHAADAECAQRHSRIQAWFCLS